MGLGRYMRGGDCGAMSEGDMLLDQRCCAAEAHLHRVSCEVMLTCKQRTKTPCNSATAAALDVSSVTGR